MSVALNSQSQLEYRGRTEAVVASGALSLEHYCSPLAISGTVAYTLARPRWEGQQKLIYSDTAVSTPVATLAVASCKGESGAATTQTYAGFGDVAASTPKMLLLTGIKHPTEGLVWVHTAHFGVTVS